MNKKEKTNEKEMGKENGKSVFTQRGEDLVNWKNKQTLACTGGEKVTL